MKATSAARPPAALAILLPAALCFSLLAWARAGDENATGPLAITVEPSRGADGTAQIAMGEGNSRKFHVVLTNTSKEPQAVFRASNSWGYYNIGFDVALADGKKLKIVRGPCGFTRNGPGTFVIPAGEKHVFDIDLDQWWEVKPQPPANGDYAITLKAFYAVAETKESKEYKVWTGRAESPEYKVKLSLRVPELKKVEPKEHASANEVLPANTQAKDAEKRR